MNHDHDHHPHHDGLAELLDLDAEIFATTFRAVFADIENATDGSVRSILDLGAGTGTGTFGLLQHFTEARAVAVDSSAEMLTHLEQRAERLGLTDRVTTLQADLDENVPPVEAVDLAWAAASLHHVADPDRTVAQIAAAVRPGGLFAVAEMDGLPRFLTDDTAGGAAEGQAHALLTGDRAVDMPAMGSDWGPRLTDAGLVIELHRAIAVDGERPSPGTLGRYAAATLSRIRGAVAERLDADRLRDFDTLLDGGAGDVRHRTDLAVSARRWLWIARRPL